MKEKGYAQLIAVGALVLAVGAAIWFVYEKGHDAGYAEAYGEIREAEIAQDSREDTASTGLEVDREKTRTVYQTITKTVDRIVERPVYTGQCFDSEGLALANAALAGATMEARDAVVPGPAGGEVRQPDR